MPRKAAGPCPKKKLSHCWIIYKSGLNFFDTANAYSNGASEEILDKAIKKYSWQRESIVVATKVFFPVGRNGDQPVHRTAYGCNNSGYLNQWGLSRKHIFDSVEASLRRLNVEYIDLLQIHQFDPETPVQEIMEALHDVVKSGKVHYIGACSMWAHQLLEMQYAARLRGLTEFISMQNLYTPSHREEEREVIPACLKLGVGGLPRSPLMSGFLTRGWRVLGRSPRAKTLNNSFMGYEFTTADRKVNEKIDEIAHKRRVSMAMVAIAWSLSKPFVVAPIVGFTTREHVDEAIRAVELKLSEAEIREIEACYEPRKVISHK